MSNVPAPLTVAIDVGPLYGHRTGVGVAAAGMADALAARDDVRLDRFLVSGRSRPLAGDRRLPLPGIVASHLWSRTTHLRADRWLRGADVVHGTNYVAPPSAVPTIVSVYDCWFLRHPELAGPVVRRAGRWLAKTVRSGAWVHASSAATAAQVGELLNTDRVVTIHLGADDARTDAPPATAPDVRLAALGAAPFVVCIGTEERRKGLALAVAAFTELAVDRRDLHLVLAGAPGDDSEVVERAIAACPASDRIVRLGPVDEPTKRWLYAHAAVLAYPSLDEGFGFPVLEANAAGLPIVATSVGSVPEVIGVAGLLVDGRDPTDFAAALEAVIGDDERRRRLIDAGAGNLSRFRWSTTAERLVDLYRTAIAA